MQCGNKTFSDTAHPQGLLEESRIVFQRCKDLPSQAKAVCMTHHWSNIYLKGTESAAEQGSSHRCHVPVTGKVAGLSYRDMQGLRLPCLVSKPLQAGIRKTQYTVEAMALEPQGEVTTWYGINQSASTRYIGHFLTAGAIPEIVKEPGLLAAERKV